MREIFEGQVQTALPWWREYLESHLGSMQATARMPIPATGVRNSIVLSPVTSTQVEATTPCQLAACFLYEKDCLLGPAVSYDVLLQH